MTGMWIAEKRIPTRVQWSAQKFQESSRKLDNRERGFYQLAGFFITDEKEQAEAWYEQVVNRPAGVQLILLEINLQNYASREISQNGITQIRRIFQAYQEQKTDLIVRFLYDWEGRAISTEPADLDTILVHMEQLKEVMHEFADSVYIVQGVFAGNWGEMNGSRHLREKSYLKLLEKLHEAVPESTFLAVRTPSYWRMAAGRKSPLDEEEAWQPNRLISRLSLYNDGIMGNELDYGTYGTAYQKDAGTLKEHWVREEELAFQNQLNQYVPNGGEVIINNMLNDLEQAVPTLKEMHVSYLNDGYDEEVLNKWKNSRYSGTDTIYQGMSGYDYIERHLGYRFVIRNAKIKRTGFLQKRLQIVLEMQNIGFSSRYTPCHTVLSLYDCKNGKEIQRISLAADVRNWKPSDTVKITEELPLLDPGEYECYLKMTDQKRGETVWLANQDIGDEKGNYLLGKLKIS